jgi:hypothetical protein
MVVLLQLTENTGEPFIDGNIAGSEYIRDLLDAEFGRES